jgi:hypothetical protein
MVRGKSLFRMRQALKEYMKFCMAAFTRSDVKTVMEHACI